MNLEDGLRDLLRPLVAELVGAELLDRRLTTTATPELPPYETVAEYAKRHRSTPAAVRARIRRRNLHAIRPPGSREYLIPTSQPEVFGG
jgi:hypothetical protein